MPSVVIVGGGITGLATALALRQAEPDAAALSIELLEGATTTGGKLVTARTAGFIIDGGADIFLGTRAEAVEFCRAIGLGDRLIETERSTRRTFTKEGATLRPATHYADERLLTPIGGMQELVDAAAASLRSVTVRTGAMVSQVGHSAVGFLVDCADERRRSDAVVLAVPGPSAARLLSTLAPDASTRLRSVRQRSTFTVSAAYLSADCPHPLDGYGYLVPGSGPGEVSAVTWTSSKIACRAPDGTVLLRGYVHGGDGVAIEQATTLVLAEFGRTLGIKAAPLVVRSYSWRDALPDVDAETPSIAADVRSALASFPGLELAGTALDGRGIPDCIASARRAARAVLRSVGLSHLTSRTTA